jgi:TonB family protein
MNSASFYRKPGRLIFWIAFMTAVAIHLGVVALAKNKSTATKPECFTPLAAVDIIDAAEPEFGLEESVTPPPLEQIRADEESFPEENAKPLPVRPHHRAGPVSLVRGTPTASLRFVKAMVTYAPRPVYPYEARRQRVTGSGVAVLAIDQTTGTVIDAAMEQSCGNAILDKTTLDTIRRWRFKPGNVTRVQVPITYTLMGVSY